MKKMNVSERVFDVGSEVTDLSSAAGALQMIVHPAYEDLFRSEHHEVLEGFAFLEQSDELLVVDEVDRSQQTDLHVNAAVSQSINQSRCA